MVSRGARVFGIGGVLVVVCGVLLAVALTVAARHSMRTFPASLNPPPGEPTAAIVLDRNGLRLSASYTNAWNFHDQVALHQVPKFLMAAMIEAEDHRFYEHGGVDWRARGVAVFQNIRSGRAVRGASTITEQVVRLLHPRPRTLWSRFLEGVEARELEREHSKGEILEFYLNQVPYARNRRGVVQAARDLFDRDLETLRRSEMATLAVLPRAPSRLDPRGARRQDLGGALDRLAQRLEKKGLIDSSERAEMTPDSLDLASSQLEVEAPHFLRHVRANEGARPTEEIQTTLDAGLQQSVEELLNRRITTMDGSDVRHGAALVIDHQKNEILAWVSGGAPSEIDSVLALRQPGSTLKPFLYALALEDGMTAATLLDDSPMVSAVGSGLHRYRNYSRRYRGPIRIREALGNSLNVPAVHVIEALSTELVLGQLQGFGFQSLNQHPEHYGAGLALGVGEVSLAELVSAYAVIARGGAWQPVSWTSGGAESSERLLSSEVATLIGDVLSDPDARAREFERGGVLEFPVQTAVKTGTSNDYRDAWAVGFSDRYTAGVWFGNLDRGEMRGVTGSAGPAFVLRSIFAELTDPIRTQPLRLAKGLRSVRICAVSGALAAPSCPSVDEWFRPENVPQTPCPLHGEHAQASEASRLRARSVEPKTLKLVRPAPGLHLALDPRIPDELERFSMEIETDAAPTRVEWSMDGKVIARIEGGGRKLLWAPSRGEHAASVRAYFSEPGFGEERVESETVHFEVR